jgi:zinc protease
MRKLAILALLITAPLLIGCPPAAVETATVGVNLYEADSPFIAFNIWVKAGSQNDPAGKEGLAALTATYLADSSTTEDSYQDILEKLYPMAAYYGASVDKEMTNFSGRIHKDNLESYYTLFKNSLLKPGFVESDFERVKNQLLNYVERSRRYNRDEELSKELLMAEVFKGTPYGHPEEGYVTSVTALTLDDVKQFYADNYLKNNIVIGLAGGYPAGFDARVQADFDTLPEKEVAAVAKPEVASETGIKILLVEKETNASPISIGFPIPLMRGDDDFHAMMVMNSWFGEHRNSFSHLYNTIREVRGMNYGDYSYIEAFPAGYSTQVPVLNVGRSQQLFEIWIRPISNTGDAAGQTTHDRTLFATKAALRELKALVDNGMTQETFETTQGFLSNYYLNWATTISRRLSYAIDDKFFGLDDGFLASMQAGLDALDLAKVNDAIKRNMQYDNMYIVIITNDAEGLKAKMLAPSSPPITYAGEKPQSLLDEDLEIASFPINATAENITIIKVDEVFEK